MSDATSLTKEEKFQPADSLILSQGEVEMIAGVSHCQRRICIDDLDSFIYLSVAQAKLLRDWLNKVLSP